MSSAVTLRGQGLVRINSASGGNLTIVGPLTMSADRTIAAGQNDRAGTVRLSANLGAINIMSGATLTADAVGAASEIVGTNGASVRGGFVNVYAGNFGGSLTIAGDLIASVNGTGGATLVDGVNAGNGTGGNIAISAFDPNSSLTINGGATFSANGFGGSGNAGQCFSCNGTAGNGLGGNVYIQTLSGTTGGSVTIGDDVLVNANGVGGNSNSFNGRGDGGTISATFAASGSILFDRNVDFNATGTGGSSDGASGGYGKGGRITMGSQNNAPGGSLTITGLVVASVDGTGGDALFVGIGGTGEGGVLDNGGAFGTVNFQSGFDGFARGYGGASDSSIGGQGLGGSGWIDAFGANVTVGDHFGMNVGGFGGNGASGGFGRGGSAYLASRSSLLLTGNADLSAQGEGGEAFSGERRSRTGRIGEHAGNWGRNTTVQGDVSAIATGEGGEVYDGLGASGDGDGGTVSVHAGKSGTNPSSGTLLISGSLTGVSDGIGGAASVAGARNGNGFGAETHVWSSANSNLAVDGPVNLSANGLVDAVGECSDCGGGGSGTGGNLFVSSNGAGSFLTFEDDLTATADGYGGVSNASIAGGPGRGGSLGFHANDGGTTVVQYADLSASGFGGYDANSASGGAGEGGNANVSAHSAASTVTVNGLLTITALGEGANSAEGAAGSAEGGFAGVHSHGLVTLNQNVILNAHAAGGSTGSGTGGNATGGNTYVDANGGDVVLNANLSMNGSAAGGSGLIGGSATCFGFASEHRNVEPNCGRYHCAERRGRDGDRRGFYERLRRGG